MVGDFNIDAYSRSDWAKWMVAQHLSSTGWWVQVFEDYKVDIQAKRTDGMFSVNEVEHRQVWKQGQPFPYDEIHIPERKRHLIEEHGNVLFFWVVDEVFARALVIPSGAVYGTEVVDTTRRDDEKFMLAPIAKARLVYLLKGPGVHEPMAAEKSAAALVNEFFIDV